MGAVSRKVLSGVVHYITLDVCNGVLLIWCAYSLGGFHLHPAVALYFFNSLEQAHDSPALMEETV